jgi:hypothetical protein
MASKCTFGKPVEMLFEAEFEQAIAAIGYSKRATPPGYFRDCATRRRVIRHASPLATPAVSPECDDDNHGR